MSVEDPLGTTYEIAQPPPSDPVVARLERWHLQSVARAILPDERVATCLRHIIPGQNGVKVHKHGDRAHYSGLLVCGSVWVCPVCASKISERRRVELVQAMEAWKAQGGTVYMLTLTVPHYLHQPLREVLDRFTRSRRLMRNRKPWKNLAARIGLAGSTRALEVTYGENGWHVHSHELLFLRSGGDLPDMEELGDLFYAMWRDACLSAGFGEPSRDHGSTIQDGRKAGDYASKWGLEHELTKAHIKKGREGNLSPWDLLRRVDQGDPSAAALFQEYARGFKRHHQLEWSKGLRDLLGLGVEASDQELAERIEEEAVLLGKLSWKDWRKVLRADRRGELLEVAAKFGWAGVVQFVVSLSDAPG